MTSAGLWIASDNFNGSQMCAGVRTCPGSASCPTARPQPRPGHCSYISGCSAPASVGRELAKIPHRTRRSGGTGGGGRHCVQAASAQGVGGVSPPAGVVSATPVTDTPHLKTTDDNPTQQIRQLVQCGGTMYAVGHLYLDQEEQHGLHPQQHLQLQRHRALHW